MKKLPPALNSVQSQKFGRRVYLLENGDHKRWLKIQLKDSNAEYQQGFLNELKIYDLLNRMESPEHSVIGNFSIFNPYNDFQCNENILDEALWLEDFPMLFAEDPNQLNDAELLLRLKLSLDVLENLHGYGLVHGDLKKEHFRKCLWNASLIDFEQTLHIDQIGKGIIGTAHSATPRYMAPEQFHGKAKSFQSDIYALGIIWFEWLTQQRLSAKSYQDWAILHCQQLKIDLPERFQHLFPVLNLILKKNIELRCSNIYQIKQQLS